MLDQIEPTTQIPVSVATVDASSAVAGSVASSLGGRVVTPSAKPWGAR